MSSRKFLGKSLKQHLSRKKDDSKKCPAVDNRRVLKIMNEEWLVDEDLKFWIFALSVLFIFVVISWIAVSDRTSDQYLYSLDFLIAFIALLMIILGVFEYLSPSTKAIERYSSVLLYANVVFCALIAVNIPEGSGVAVLLAFLTLGLGVVSEFTGFGILFSSFLDKEVEEILYLQEYEDIKTLVTCKRPAVE